MNNNRLARLYDQLTIWERIPLLVSANARGDDTEYQRLLDASPTRTCWFSEHLLAEQALHVMAMIYIGEQLDAAAVYFFALWQLKDTKDPPREELLDAIQANAYFFTVNAEAWRHFCAELGISADQLTNANHHGWFLRYCEENMPANTPSAEAIQARLRESGREAGQAITSDDLLQSWRKLLRAMTGHAPPTTELEPSCSPSG